MIKYATGFRRQIYAKWFWGSFMVKCIWGAIRGYPVHRVTPDHSVYVADNRRLPSTTWKRARLIHRISHWENHPKLSLVEFEHPFMLVGSMGEGIDYTQMRTELPDLFCNLAATLDPRRDRLVATSAEAGKRAISIFRRYGMTAPEQLVSVLPWSGVVRRRSLPSVVAGLQVFHYGGLYPASKGTLDVLRLASLLPQVTFHISVTIEHPMLPRHMPANVRLYPVNNRKLYYQALRSSHVVLHPIYSDGWGVVIDALAHAMPVVLYDSYDKPEAIEDGLSGRLVALPSALSLYDGFWEGPYRNALEFEAFVADSFDEARVLRLAEAICAYADDHELLKAHSFAASALFAAKHDPERRARKIQALYHELLYPREHSVPSRHVAP